MRPADIPIPVGADGARARACCDVDRDGTHRVFFLLEGRRHGPFVGPAFRHPRQAIALARELNGG